MKRSKRGFTLVELVIALSVVTIVTALVTSFIVLMNRYFDTLTFQRSAVENLNALQRNYALYLSSADDGNYEISIDTSEGIFALKAHDKREPEKADERVDSYFKIQNEVCYVEIPGAGSTSFDCESMWIKDISMSEPNKNGTLVFVTVAYELRTTSKNTEQAQTVFSYLVRTVTREEASP